MNKHLKVWLGVLIIVVGSILASNQVYLLSHDYNDGLRDGIEWGREMAKTQLWIDEIFGEYIGEIRSIEPYCVINISKLGYYRGDVYHPFNFTIYKLDLDLTGFHPEQTFSPYVNPWGTRCVTFRYCSGSNIFEGNPIPSPGHYKFYYLNKDFMEITHWEIA